MSVREKIAQFIIISFFTFVGAELLGFYDWTFYLAMVIIPSSMIYIAVKDEGAKTRKKINDLMSLLEEKKKTE